MAWRNWLRRLDPGRGPDPDQPVAVDIGPGQPHPVDLRWADELVRNLRGHVVVRPEDELLILVPNRPTKLNATALRVLSAMLDEGLTVAEVLEREGDSAAKRRELHWFFADLQDLLRGRLGEGRGRRAVLHEPFSADFCRLPVISELALTYRCNLACRFCYAGCSSMGLPAGWDEDRALDTEAFARVLEIIHGDARCPSVSFTGGEPTLHPGLERLVAHAHTLGMKTNLISNGWLLSEGKVQGLVAAGLDSAQLSLEGPDAAVHDALVGRVGAFDRLWSGLERLREAGVRVHTNTTISRGNLAQLEGIVELVTERGLERLTMNLVIPCGTAAENEDQVRYEEIGPVVLRVQERAQALGLQFIWYSPVPLCLFESPAHGLSTPGCAAADGLLHVSPAGDVLPCSSFSHHEGLGNILERPFEELWNAPAPRFFRDKRMAPGPCEGCEKIEICQGACPLYWRSMGLGELGGDPEGFPPMPPGLSCAPERPCDD
jgi:radical SAM protein with 4Fe4S-binding SPASM domain